MHTPVLLEEVLAGLNVKKNGKYIDATFGEGGHAIEISKAGGKILGIEADRQQYQISNIKYQNYISKIKNLILVNDNFANIEKVAKKHGFDSVDGILFDLGLSMRQLNESKRGFSYRKLEEPLDMRLDINQELTAEKIINSYSQKELYEIFTKNSEELNSWNIAQAIASARRLSKIKTVGDFINVINITCLADQKIYSRIFQALRIEVNREFENLKKGLEGSLKLLKKDGRIAVITFHSLEDRIVKKFIRENSLKQINKKIIKGNKDLKFERSAKMRVIVNG